MGKFSSAPVYNALKRDSNWRLNDVARKHKITVGGSMKRGGDGFTRNRAINNGNNAGFRMDVKTWSFKFINNHGSAQ